MSRGFLKRSKQPCGGRPQISRECLVSGRTIDDVAERFNPSITQVDSSTAQVITGVGQAHTYTDKDGSGRYLPPAGVVNALTLNGDNTWTETRPGQFQFRYDTGGLVKTLVNPVGSRS